MSSTTSGQPAPQFQLSNDLLLGHAGERGLDLLDQRAVALREQLEADEKVLTDYAMLAPDQVNVRLLTDQASYKKTLKPAAELGTVMGGPETIGVPALGERLSTIRKPRRARRRGR